MRDVFRTGGKAERFYGGVEFAGIRNGGEFGGGDAECAEEILLGEAVCAASRAAAEDTRERARARKLAASTGTFFEFVGDSSRPLENFSSAARSV